MLIREGDQRNLEIDAKLAALFAGVAGAVNAAAFQATGFFSANMTGNLSAMSDYLGNGNARAAAIFGALLVSFVVGAFGSGLLIEAGRRRGVRAIYAYSVTLEAILLIGIGAADLLHPEMHEGPALALGLSFVMGVQNAATSRISNARVRTTHVSGMATDVGLGLAALVHRSPDRQAAVARLRLYLLAITAFALGGIVGVLVYVRVGGVLFVAAAIVLLALALPEVRRARRSPE